jgi:hypothetical protein
MPNNSAPSSLDGLGTMNSPRSYLFIVALCLAHVALMDATPTPVVVPPPPALGTRGHIPPRPTPSETLAVHIRRKPDTILPGPTQPLWLNAAWIVAITGLIGAIAQLINSVRKR